MDQPVLLYAAHPFSILPRCPTCYAQEIVALFKSVLLGEAHAMQAVTPTESLNVPVPTGHSALAEEPSALVSLPAIQLEHVVAGTQPHLQQASDASSLF